MKNWKRNLLVGFIWGLIFFLWWMASFYKQNWNFELFSKASWSYLYNEFISGWVIQATSDWIFLWVLVLAVPVFIIGWNIFLKIRWRKTIFGFFKQIWYALRRLWHSLFGKEIVIGKKKVKYIKKKSHKRTRPAPLHTSAKALAKNSKTQKSNYDEMPSKPAQGVGVSQGMGASAFDEFKTDNSLGTEALGAKTTRMMPSEYPSFLDEDLSNISLDDIQLPERELVAENISEILLKAGYKLVADAQIGNMNVDYVAVDAHTAYVFVSDVEAGDWLADEEKFNGEDPLWFSESSHRVSPIFVMKTALEAFAERLNAGGITHKVVPVLVVKEGTIINAEDMKNTWNQMGVVVCRTHKGGPDELPTVGAWAPSVTEPASNEQLEMIRNAF